MINEIVGSPINEGELFGCFTIVKHLGQGACSHVYLATHNSSNTTSALKVFNHGQNLFATKEHTILETLYKQTLPASHIVQPLSKSTVEFQKKGEVAYIELEYCSNGDLFHFIKKNGPLPQVAGDSLFMNILNAVESVHLSSMSHLDLKPENILFTSEYRVKLCDFGFCESSNIPIYKNLGSVGYQSPEILLVNDSDTESNQIGGYSGNRADIFALGVILFIIHFGIPPFSEARVSDKFFKLLQFKSNKADKQEDIKYFLRSHPSTKGHMVSNKIDYSLISLLQHINNDFIITIQYLTYTMATC